MRNHHEKARDMARSVLPSTRRRGARQDRALAHARERRRLRAELHDLASYDDPDDYEGDLTWKARREIGWMVDDRRAADKVAPLLRWAGRTVERDPALRDASYEERVAHFRRLLPDGLIGRHALVHLAWVLDDEVPWWRRPTTPRPDPRQILREEVEAIVAAGRQGELNRRIRRDTPTYVKRSVTLPPERIIDEDHPSPGLLLHPRSQTVYERVTPRFLHGARDLEAFVSQTGAAAVIHELHAELVRDALI